MLFTIKVINLVKNSLVEGLFRLIPKTLKVVVRHDSGYVSYIITTMSYLRDYIKDLK